MFFCKKTKEFTIFCFIEASSFSSVLEGLTNSFSIAGIICGWILYIMRISVQVSRVRRCRLRSSKIGCHVSNRNNQDNSLRDAIKCWPIDLSRTELIFLIFEELHLHNKTVVAKADGVVENAGEGGAGEVAEGERWGEQAGYQALNLVMCQAFFNYKW